MAQTSTDFGIGCVSSSKYPLCGSAEETVITSSVIIDPSFPTEKALTVIGDVDITGVIDPTELILTEQAAIPQAPTTAQGAIWVDSATVPGSLVFANSSFECRTREHNGTLSWSYSPTTPSDWTPVPDNVGSALDALGAVVPQSFSSFSVDVSGPWAAPRTITIDAYIANGIATLSFDGTATTATVVDVITSTAGAIPAALRPTTGFSTDRFMMIVVSDNGNPFAGALRIVSNGTFEISRFTTGAATDFSGAGLTGFTPFTVSYQL
jgi:hypothetical protein